MTHDFRTELDYGEHERLRPFWERVFRARFPDFERMDPVISLSEQRRGHDWHVTFGAKPHQVVRRIQTKSRRGEPWPDIALEYRHTWDDGRPRKDGWIELADQDYEYFAYGFPEAGDAHVFPWPELRRAWLNNRERWRALGSKSWALRGSTNQGPPCDGVSSIRARNSGYWSWSLCVHVDALKEAIVGAMSVSVAPVKA